MNFFHYQFPFSNKPGAILQLVEDLRKMGFIGELNSFGGPDELVNLSGGPITESSRTSMIMGPPLRRFRIEQPSRKDLPKGNMDEGNPLTGKPQLFFDTPAVKLLVEEWLSESNEEGTPNSGWRHCATHFAIDLASAFRTMESFQKKLPSHLPAHLPVLPGCFSGALAYELVAWTQPWQLRNPPQEGTTLAIIWQVERWLIHDKPSNTLHVLSNERDEWGAKVKKFLESWKYEPREVLPAILNGSETSSHTDLQHADIVRVVKKAITAGQLYQLNFGRRWMGELHENPWETMLRLAHDSPAPYSSWLYCPDQKIALCSSSPELLLASDGGIISTRPIKGTRPRGRDPQEEFSLRSELLKCKKENAEHRMLVDLERNELGVVCRPASIEHTLFQVESYPQVQHLVSEVKGELKSECDLWDALQATFPGGSITGCPKTVTCSAIDLLEKHPRSFWTGSIGYIDPRTSKSAWNILIRTLEAHQDNGDNGVGSGEKWQAIIQAGGGLVIGSNPEAEVDEAKWKAEALRKAAGWIERSENEGSFCAEIAIHPQPIKKQINRGFTETGDIFEGKNIDSTILKKTGSKKVRIIFIDNLDSFSYNIMHSCCGMGADVIRLCGITTPVDSFNELLSTLKPSHIILGPGPGRPNSSILTQYISKQSLLGSITNLEGDVIPILGICLGHQALGEADGMELIESPLGAVHGQPSQILHNGEGIFSQIQQPAIMARYNSLILKEKGGNNGGGYIPNQLIVNAWDETKTLPMAFYHPTLPIFGIQFHPESCGSENGIQIISTFLKITLKSQAFIAHG